MALTIRNCVPTQDTWNLEPLYASRTLFLKDIDEVHGRCSLLQRYAGSLGENLQNVESCLELYFSTSRLLEKVYTWAHLGSDVDTSDNSALDLLGRAKDLIRVFSASSSFIRPELLALSQESYEELEASESLKNYRRYLDEIYRHKPHTLSKDVEKILADGSDIFSSFSTIFSQLNNADLEFGSIETAQGSQPLTHGTYSVFLKNPDRTIRHKAYEQYYDVFDCHKYTLNTVFCSSVRKNLYLARSRKFSSALEQALFADNIPVTVYDKLIQTVSENLGPLHDYYQIRQKRLNIDTLELYDTYIPLETEIKTEITYDQACDLVIDSLAFLGGDYCRELSHGLIENRWVDKYENKGKRSGAYSAGCYDSYPYILLNYNSSDLRDVFTLAHEAGHSMHSLYSRRHQPYPTSDYSIFVAEVASTLNEQLLMAHLRQKYAHDSAMTAYLINHQIDDIKATLYRQTMFAEFEKIVHEKAHHNEPITPEANRDTYCELLKKYFGPSVRIHPLGDLEYLRIPHFYYGFYVYKYATGLSAALALSKEILGGNSEATKRYLKFLSSGSSKDPIELLKDAGVDLSSELAINQALSVFSSLVEDYKRICNT